MSRVRRAACAALALAATLLVLPASAAAAAPPRGATHPFPTSFSLPNGFPPEGIAIGGGPFAYFGSRLDGDIYRANLVTGRGRVISEGPGTQSLGMKLDRRGRLFVAGGSAGNARVVDVRTGAVLARYPFATGVTFVNDVVLTSGAAYFTDSRNPVLYVLPFGRHGRLPSPAQVVTVPLSGEFQNVTGETNANGIARTPDGRGLLVVNSFLGLLYRVDPWTGATTEVDLGVTVPPGIPGPVINGDGLLVLGRTLYVVQNRLNQIGVFRLNDSGTRGRLVDQITDPRFDIPTTVAAFGTRLYLPNARFTTPVTPDTPYSVVAVRRH